jgi:hypothetical protein
MLRLKFQLRWSMRLLRQISQRPLPKQQPFRKPSHRNFALRLKNNLAAAGVVEAMRVADRVAVTRRSHGLPLPNLYRLLKR